MLQFPLEQLLKFSLLEFPIEALKAEKSFLFFDELHSGQNTSSWLTDDLCRISNFALQSEHLYSNNGIDILRF